MEDVVVTGMGAITPIGNNLELFWNSLMGGIDGYTNKQKYLPDNYPFKKVGLIHDFCPDNYLTNDEIKNLDRAAQLSVAASIEAVNDAKLDINYDNEIPVIIGTTCGANLSIEEDFDEFWFSELNENISSKKMEKYRHCSLANAISDKLKLKGPSYIIGTACASGNHAVGEAFDLISKGKYDIIICGGADALSLLPLYGFHSIKSLSTEKCMPFDRNRDGIIIGESAGIIVIESLKNALKRNAKIYAKVLNWAINCDAKIFSSPILDGTRSGQLLLQCLQNAELEINDIDYINLHGTGSKKNDLMEINGIKQAFKNSANSIPVSSIKSMIGHTLGAAGALDDIVSILSIEKGEIPPITNTEIFDEGFDLNFITKKKYKHNVNHALSLSFAFGGCNVATIFGKY